MSAHENRGRLLVLLCAVSMLALEAFALGLVLYLDRLTTLRLIQVTVRIAIDLVIIAFLLRGAPWARWLSATLYGAGGLFAAFSLPGAIREAIPAVVLLDVVFGFVGVTLAAVLILSPSTKLYFASARQRLSSRRPWPAV